MLAMTVVERSERPHWLLQYSRTSYSVSAARLDRTCLCSSSIGDT